MCGTVSWDIGIIVKSDLLANLSVLLEPLGYGDVVHKFVVQSKEVKRTFTVAKEHKVLAHEGL